MNVGFTGTRKGMSGFQKVQFERLMRWLCDVREFHHGAAIGADTEATFFLMLFPKIAPIAHPAGNDPLARNRRIVEASDMLIAAPDTNAEQLRSGTWATVRYAREACKPVIMLSRGRHAKGPGKGVSSR